jgi:hypothetical protein
MGHYNFNKDIIEGEEGEKLVIEHLKKLGATPIHQNKDNRYDVLVERNGQKVKYEIKTDVFCEPSFDKGNMFLETECRGNFSGVNVTEADWFVTYFKHLKEIWYIKTEDLNQLISENKENWYHATFAGDKGSNTKGWLMPRFEYKHNFMIFDSETFEKKTEIYIGSQPKFDYERFDRLLSKNEQKT